MGDPAWEEYRTAAQRLDTVRRDAAAAAAEQAAASQAARQELAYLRGRLSLHRENWQVQGLEPAPAEVAAASQAVGDDPAAVLQALRRARLMVDEADAAVMAGPGPRGGPAGWPPRLRNLLVYGPLAMLALITQVALIVLASETLIPLCGLVLPAIAFLVGYVAIGLVFPAPPGGRVDRTPLLGAAVCLASVTLLCTALGLLAISR